MTDRNGPLEGVDWPRALAARVVTPDQPVRIHGYDVAGDLARSYRPSDTLFLSLTGELPGEDESRALEIVVQLLAPVSIAEAPAHAASLAQLCRSRTSGVLATAAAALAEQARWIVDQHRDLLEALDAGKELPAAFRDRGAADRDILDALDRLLPQGLAVGGLSERPTGDAALLSVLHALGLRSPWQLETTLVWARLPVVMAEAMATPPGRFRSYPMDLPAYRYEEGD